MKKVKTFKDLEFGPHPNGDGKAAKMFFKNGYGVSVVRFTVSGMVCSYTNGDEWELAVLKGNKDDWELTYDTHITDDVMGHLVDSEVTRTMNQVQQLEAVL